MQNQKKQIMRVEGPYQEPDDPMKNIERRLDIDRKKLEVQKLKQDIRQNDELHNESIKDKRTERAAKIVRIGMSIAAAAVALTLCFLNDKFPFTPEKLVILLTMAGFTINWSSLIPMFKRKELPGEK